MPLLDSLLWKVVHYLTEFTGENSEFWDRVKNDQNHVFYFACMRLKNGDEENRLSIFKEELKASILSALKVQDSTKNIAYLIMTNDEARLKLDLRSSQSVIIQHVVDIVRIAINVYTNDGKSCNFSSCYGLYKQNFPLSIQLSRNEDKFIDVDLSYQYKARSKKPIDLLGEAGLKEVKGEDILVKKSKKRKLCKQKYKSAEIVSSSDSDDSCLSSKKVKKSCGNRVQNNLDKEGNYSDFSCARDLDLSDTDTEGYVEGSSKIDMHVNKEHQSVDFADEVKKLRDAQNIVHEKGIYKDQGFKKDVKVSVSEAGKRLQDFPTCSVMYQENVQRIQSNLIAFVEITERMKKHALVMQNNLLPSNMETCLCCPNHCAQALVKATKDKRGPKDKRGLKKKN